MSEGLCVVLRTTLVQPAQQHPGNSVSDVGSYVELEISTQTLRPLLH